MKRTTRNARPAYFAVSGMLLAGLLAGCGGSSTTSPASGGSSSLVGPAPATAAVTVGDIFYKSVLNGTSNAAVDTLAVGGTVTWTWAANETMPHGVQSVGTPSFTSGPILSGAGSTYSATFAAAGVYHYDCAVHGQLMTGTIVVLTPATPGAVYRRGQS